MKIESAAGEFEFTMESLVVKDDSLILSGKMGVWEAETVLEPQDVRMLLKLLLGKPSCWRYMLRLPFMKKDSQSATEN